MYVERTERTRRAPLRALLVLAALLGVLGMHGLSSPGGFSAVATAVSPVAVQSAPHHDPAAGGHDCPPEEPRGDHGEHAGEMCLANAPAAPFSPPPLAPALPPVTGEPSGAAGAAAPDAAFAGRAPPSLADLQLLRI